MIAGSCPAVVPPEAERDSLACGEQALEPAHVLSRACLAALQPVPRVPVSAQLAPALSSVPLRRGQVALARLAGRGPLRCVHAG